MAGRVGQVCCLVALNKHAHTVGDTKRASFLKTLPFCISWVFLTWGFAEAGDTKRASFSKSREKKFHFPHWSQRLSDVLRI